MVLQRTHFLGVLACVGALILGGCSSSDDSDTTSAPFLAIDDMANVSFDDRQQEDIAIPLVRAGFPITDQTFIRVYRVMADGTENTLTIARLAEGQTTYEFLADFPHGVSESDLSYEIYSPETVGTGVTLAPTAVSCRGRVSESYVGNDNGVRL